MCPKNTPEYRAMYNHKHYDRFTVELRKDSMLKSRLETLVVLTNKSKNTLMIEALEMLLKKYGIE